RLALSAPDRRLYGGSAATDRAGLHAGLAVSTCPVQLLRRRLRRAHRLDRLERGAQSADHRGRGGGRGGGGPVPAPPPRAPPLSPEPPGRAALCAADWTCP